MCVSLILAFIFFFKQKTAYEMRISDWSSDVCSSDLAGVHELAFGENLAARRLGRSLQADEGRVADQLQNIGRRCGSRVDRGAPMNGRAARCKQALLDEVQVPAHQPRMNPLFANLPTTIFATMSGDRKRVGEGKRVAVRCR